ncbi:uncharacterized protein [Rutidosis leptorrhynchoides]|uniref:uncharacterized protein n=1 Tax=Rutidosis leptorrhynchoides TaxID=125765 RepID=UPI003A99C35D
MSSTSSSNEGYSMQVLDIINSEALESENEAESSNTRHYIDREHEAAHVRLITDYFVEAYGDTPDLFDEYLQMSEQTCRESLMNFCKCIIDLSKVEYMLEPTTDDIKQLYEAHEDIHGLPGMMGSIDCIHWAWEKCPVAWKGQFTRGDHKVPTIMLEVLASYDKWIWHAFFGVAGSNNDLNLLNASNLFNSMLNEEIEDIPFTVNGVEYKKGYYLVDGIYPRWASFVKAFSSANDDKCKYFSKKQVAARKDVERTFGILQGRWHILQQPAKAYSINVMKQMMYTCIILHNRIVEDNGFTLTENDWVYEPVRNMQTTWIERCETYKRRTKELRDREMHESL